MTKAEIGTLYMAVLGGAELTDAALARVRASRIVLVEPDVQWLVETMLRTTALEHDHYELCDALNRIAGRLEGPPGEALEAIKRDLADLRAALAAAAGEASLLQQALLEGRNQQSAPYRPSAGDDGGASVVARGDPLWPELAHLARARPPLARAGAARRRPRVRAA